MFEHGIPAKWLRRANWATCLFFGSFALGGLWYVFASALSRDVLGAVIGAGVVWGSLGLGIGMHCVTQMAGVVDANVRALTDFRRRLDATEALVDQLGPELNLSETGVGDPSQLVAARTTSDAFPRLIRQEADALDAEFDGLRSADEPEPEVAYQPSDTALREAFRAAVFNRDFTRALAVGDEIAERFPESSMAEQFHDLRGLMERRVQGNNARRPLSARV